MVVTAAWRHDVLTGRTNVINWDGYGYYVYLPGVFVYGDVTDYAFAEDHFATYDVGGDGYQLNPTDDGGRFPIYNIGLAVVWTPAFLLTHGLTVLLAPELADGMSYPYQLMVVLMGLLFAFLGLLYLRRWLARYFPDAVVALTVLGVGLGTNIFYYLVEKPDMTHGYLFALYAALAYYLDRVADRRATARELLRLGLLAGLMCLIRSSEIVLFALPAAYGLRDRLTLGRNFRRTLILFGVAALVFGVQLLYYRLATGGWWQDGYAGLGFDWAAPHLFEGFFSYRRGWLVYTPLMAGALVGLALLPRRRPLRPWFLPLLIFLVGNCYLLFSWHIWWYGNTFGSRPVTQSYALLALPLAALLATLWGADAGAGRGRGAGVVRRGVAVLVVVAATALNLFQHWQYNRRILPLDFTNRTYYWHVFGATQLDRRAYVYLDTDEKLPAGPATVTPLVRIDTTVVVAPHARREFTALHHTWAPASAPEKTSWLRTTLVYSYHGDHYDKWRFPSVVTEHTRDGEQLRWTQVKIPPAMTNPALDSLTFDLSLGRVGRGERVKQYVWNLSADSMTVHALRCEIVIAN